MDKYQKLYSMDDPMYPSGRKARVRGSERFVYIKRIRHWPAPGAAPLNSTDLEPRGTQTRDYVVVPAAQVAPWTDLGRAAESAAAAGEAGWSMELGDPPCGSVEMHEDVKAAMLELISDPTTPGALSGGSYCSHCW